MSYQKCNLCHERYKGVHLCKPEWETEHLWGKTFEEDRTVRAHDAEGAAERWAEFYDDDGAIRNSDGCTKERIRVRLLGSSDPWQVFDVTASQSIDYSVEAVTE